MNWIGNAIIITFLMYAGWHGLKLTIGDDRVVIEIYSLKKQIEKLKNKDS